MQSFLLKILKYTAHNLTCMSTTINFKRAVSALRQVKENLKAQITLNQKQNQDKSAPETNGIASFAKPRELQKAWTGESRFIRTNKTGKNVWINRIWNYVCRIIQWTLRCGFENTLMLQNDLNFELSVFGLSGRYLHTQHARHDAFLCFLFAALRMGNIYTEKVEHSVCILFCTGSIVWCKKRDVTQVLYENDIKGCHHGRRSANKSAVLIEKQMHVRFWSQWTRMPILVDCTAEPWWSSSIPTKLASCQNLCFPSKYNPRACWNA